MPNPDQPSSTKQSDLRTIVAKLTDLQVDRIDTYANPKIPKFYKQDPSCWFLIVEASLDRMSIRKEKARANALITQLNPDIVAYIKDILNVQPQPEYLYTQIKNRVLTTYTISKEARLRQLLKGEVMNEGKPSLMLNHVRSLNNNACNDDVLRETFLDQLPASIRAILAMSQVSTLSTLATLLDKVCEASNPSGVQTFAVAPRSSATQNAANSSATSSSPSSIDSLATIVNQLPKQVKSLTIKLNQSEQQRGRPSYRSNSHGPRNRSNSSKNHEGDLCYYHARFCKCQAPCFWKKNEIQTSEN